MSDPKKVFYELQFNVISYSPYGVPVDICFHGPKAMGFSSVEMAQKVIEELTEGDIRANKIHVYDIVPVMVAEDFGKGPEVTFSMDGNEDLMEDQDEDDGEPPASN